MYIFISTSDGAFWQTDAFGYSLSLRCCPGRRILMISTSSSITKVKRTLEGRRWSWQVLICTAVQQSSIPRVSMAIVARINQLCQLQLARCVLQTGYQLSVVIQQLRSKLRQGVLSTVITSKHCFPCTKNLQLASSCSKGACRCLTKRTHGLYLPVLALRESIPQTIGVFQSPSDRYLGAHP